MIHDLYEFTCLPLYDCLEESSLCRSDDRCPTRHRLYRRHAEVFIDRDIDRRDSSLDESYESIIIWGFEESDIFMIANLRKYLIFHRVIFSICQYKSPIWHLEKCLYDDIDTLGRRKTSKGEEVGRSSKFKVQSLRTFHFSLFTFHWSEATRISRWIDDLTVISREVLESFLYIFRVRDDRIHMGKKRGIFTCLSVEKHIRKRVEKYRDP